VITLDTSALIALFDRRERAHEAVAAALRAAGRPYLVPAATLGEVTYFLEERHGTNALLTFVDDLEARRFELDAGEDDLSRIAELIRRYDDLPLGFVDAAVVACAERSGGAVLTLDGDFSVVAREGRLDLRP
jgi:predicted nucleic acid-binding protein